MIMDGVIKRLEPAAESDEGVGGPFWHDAGSRIARGLVTPIIGNQATRLLLNAPIAHVAQAWATDIQSPLPDHENADLARVAQYHAVHLQDVVEAKRQYLEAMKGYLVASARDDPLIDAAVVEQFMDVTTRGRVSLSSLADQLGYPRFPDIMSNPLRLLAELPLPIYLTTSPHKFLEIELAKTGHKTPESALFYWHDGLRFIPSVFELEPGYVPSVERPLVYHLFGDDQYPESLVLTEDDYLDYLVKLSTLSHEVKHADTVLDIPACVTLALTGKALVLLGYRTSNWDFRVLFKGLIQATGESRNKLTPKSICVQLEPAAEAPQPDAIKQYLSQLFEQAHFSVYWSDLCGCATQMYQVWKGG